MQTTYDKYIKNLQIKNQKQFQKFNNLKEKFNQQLNIKYHFQHEKYHQQTKTQLQKLRMNNTNNHQKQRFKV